MQCVEFLKHSKAQNQLRELKRVCCSFLSYLRYMGERKQIMMMLVTLIRIIKKEPVRYRSL